MCCSICHLPGVATKLCMTIGGVYRLLNTSAPVAICAMFIAVVAIARIFVAVVIVLACADLCICR